VSRIVDPKLAATMISRLETIQRKQSRALAAIEAYPHISDRICALWGYPEIWPYLERLVLIEANRSGRQGFPLEVQAELMVLYQLIVDHPRLIRHGHTKLTHPSAREPFSFTR
jgi:hypothetical protein